MAAKSRSQSKRHRGYILTPAGAKKLQKRITELEATTGIKYNPPKIAEQSQLMSPQGLHATTIRKILRGTSGGDESSLRLIFQVVGLELEDLDYTLPGLEELIGVKGCCDWGEAIDVSVFYGRESELRNLKQWILEDHCRLITLLGMGGIGKTTLSVKLAQQLQDRYEFVVWRSLRNTPMLEELLSQVMQFVSQQQELDRNLLKIPSQQISSFMDYLRQKRCLLVFDNLETILSTGSPAGQYLPGYENYGELFRRIAETSHQSCLILTSREKPQGIAAFEGESLPVRSWSMGGLTDAEGSRIFSAKGLMLSSEQSDRLTQLYHGNPLALKIVATSIQQLFAGNVGEFLAQNVAVFNGIRNLLATQFERLSSLEQRILYWLAINREPVTIEQLHEDIIPRVSLGSILESLEFIGWRSLIEQVTPDSTPRNAPPGDAIAQFTPTQQFTLQAVVMEYVSDRLIEQVCAEIYQISESKNLAHLNLFKYLALMKAESQDYVRTAQINTILQPILEKLSISFGSQKNLSAVFSEILANLRANPAFIPGYIAGNILNLLVHLQTDLSGYDFSALTIWQAYLQGINLRRVNFAQANLGKSVFSEIFGNIYGIALSADGKILASGHADGEVRLWQVENGKLLFRTVAHHSTVWSVAFSPLAGYSATGKLTGMFASSSFDGSIRVWDLSQQKLHQSLSGHRDWVWGITFSGDGKCLASCSSDRTIKLWEIASGNCFSTLTGHDDIVNAVAWSGDGQLLASGSADRSIRLWNLQTGECCQILHGHTDRISSVAFSPDDSQLASCEAQSIKIWNLDTGECEQTFAENLTFVWSIAFSRDGKTLIAGDGKVIKFWSLETAECYQVLSGYSSQIWSVAVTGDPVQFSHSSWEAIAASDKQTLKIWQIESDQKSRLLQTIQGYTNSVWSVAFAGDHQTLASGGTDQIVSLWNLNNQSEMGILVQHQKSVRAIAFSPDNQWLASGSEDKRIHLWDRKNSKHFLPLIGHTSGIWSVTFSPDGGTLASGSADNTIRLWDVKNFSDRISHASDFYPIFKILSGHESWVLSVAFSPDGQYLASSSADQTIRLWDLNTGQCLKILLGHQGFIWAIAFSADGKTLASASEDQTIKLWNVHTGECQHSLQGHQSFVWSVAFCPPSVNQKTPELGAILASSSVDQTIRLWNARTGQCVGILEGHKSAVWSVAFSPDGKTLASGSNDETIKLWDIFSGHCITTFQPERIYQGMNITGVTGLTPAQKATLKALGALEE